jgi:hypothetical protein
MAIEAEFTAEELPMSSEPDISRGMAHSACQNACFLAKLWHDLKD